MIVRPRTQRWLLLLLHRSLSVHREYKVISIESDCFRLCANLKSGPCLYEKRFFDVVDISPEADWEYEWDDDDCIHTHIRGMPKYVWEDYHDRVPEVVTVVNQWLANIAPLTWNAPTAVLQEAARDPNDQSALMLDKLRLILCKEQLLAWLAACDLVDSFYACSLYTLFPDETILNQREQWTPSQVEAYHVFRTQIRELWDELEETPCPLEEYLETEAFELFQQAARKLWRALVS